MKMISDSQVYVLNAGDSVVLECYFSAAKYNMFDYPLLWKKVLPVLMFLVPCSQHTNRTSTGWAKNWATDS